MCESPLPFTCNNYVTTSYIEPISLQMMTVGVILGVGEGSGPLYFTAERGNSSLFDAPKSENPS
jgi:hypothetical protein